MNQHLRPGPFLWLAYTLAAAVATVWAFLTLPATALTNMVWLLVAAVSLIRAQVKLSQGFVLPASGSIQVSAMFILPVQGVVLFETLLALIFAVRERRGWERGLFNAANNILPTLAGVALFRWFIPDWEAPLTVPSGLGIGLLAFLVRLVLNVAGIHIKRAFVAGQPIAEGIRTTFNLGWPSMAVPFMALLVAVSYRAGGPWMLGVAAALLLCINGAWQFYAERESLVRSAWTDGLTGVRNRRAWEETAARFREAPLGINLLIVADMDGLKQLNDTAGHLEGDRAIKELADNLVQAAGTKGNVFRFGGDEFVIFVPGATATDSVAQRILEGTRWFADEWSARGHAMTVSIGVAASPQDGETLDSLFQVADQEMYRIKRRRAEVAAAVERLEVGKGPAH